MRSTTYGLATTSDAKRSPAQHSPEPSVCCLFLWLATSEPRRMELEGDANRRRRNETGAGMIDGLGVRDPPDREQQ